MNNSISYDIKNAIKTEKSLIAESILIHNKDVSLNFDTKTNARTWVRTPLRSCAIGHMIT
jgi:hypothetical protein